MIVRKRRSFGYTMRELKRFSWLYREGSLFIVDNLMKHHVDRFFYRSGSERYAITCKMNRIGAEVIACTS